MNMDFDLMQSQPSRAMPHVFGAVHDPKQGLLTQPANSLRNRITQETPWTKSLWEAN